MTEKRVRLHVTPFSKDLAHSLLSIHPTLAANSISLHTIDTFPENDYGYIELPVMEAERLKTKLNGSILRGKKLRVENAHPKKNGTEPERNNDESVQSEQKGLRSSKRRREPDAEIKGYELDTGRKVKRGWTDPDKAKRKSSRERTASSSGPSKYTDQPECMFRVRIPPNKDAIHSGSTETQKSRDTRKGRPTAMVHEFEKSVIQPSFLKQPASSKNKGETAEYVEGKGWIDGDGDLVDEERPRNTRTRNATREPKETKRALQSQAEERAQSSNGDRPNSSQKDAKMATPASEKLIGMAETTIKAVDEETSTSGTSQSDPESSSETSEDEDPEPESQNDTGGQDAKSRPSDSIHPLETLFKRPNQAASQTGSKRPLEIKTTFNFFEPDQEKTMPQTPFTTRDLQMRGLRSAAPTPDTAHPSRRFFAESISPSSSTGHGTGADPAGPADSMKQPQEPQQRDEDGDFQKWFWEHRGQNNRAWKRRRKEALKENRQRENRQKGRRVG